MKLGTLTAILIVACATSPLSAQQTGAAIPPSHQNPASGTAQETTAAPQPARYTSEVRLQGLFFGNFYQAANGEPAKDVRGVQVAYRGIYRPRGTVTDFYGEVNAMHFTNIDRPNPYALRVGLRHAGAVDEYNIFADRGAHRAAFDVGQRTAFATVTTFDGEWAHTFSKNWQGGAEALREQQRFDVASDEVNDYTRGSVLVRYRGLSSLFMPHIGYAVGKRDVRNNAETYREHYWFGGFTTAALNYRLYASVTYANKHRFFDPAFAGSGSFSRDDARPQWSGYAQYRLTKHLSGTAYYSRDVSRSPIAYRNFRTSFLIVGLTSQF